MSTVLLEEVADPAAAGDEGLILGQLVEVPVTVVGRDGSFLPVKTPDYSIEKESVSLVGSSKEPREFRLTFSLSAELTDLGYRFENPALQFFQGDSQTAGYCFPSELSRLEARASLFNLKDAQAPKTEGSFNVLLRDPLQKLIIHDPAIAWDPPGGGL